MYFDIKLYFRFYLVTIFLVFDFLYTGFVFTVQSFSSIPLFRWIKSPLLTH